MKKWEYRLLEISGIEHEQVSKPVDELGLDGWELVAAYQRVGLNTFKEDTVYFHFLWFKRELRGL